MTLCLVLPTLFLPLVSASEDSWTTLTPMPTARVDLGVAVVDGKIFAIGGTNGSYLNVNEMYDPVTDTWVTKTSMPTARSGFGIAVYQNKIYVIGGQNDVLDFTRVNEVYDPATDTWETRTRHPAPRAGFCANVVNGKIYLIGGFASFFSPFPAAYETYVYDPETDTWTEKTSTPTAVSNYASAVIDNKIYVIGGRYVPDMITYNLTQIYDTETDTWSYGTSLQTPISDAATGATTGVFAPTRIYVLGGTSIAGNDLNQIYDPETDTWSTGASMPTSRARLAVAVVNDTLYAIGGRNAGNFLAVNEQYTPVDYIPEFPSWIILPLFVTATLFVLFLNKKTVTSD